MADGCVNPSSLFKLLLILFCTLFAGHSSLFQLRNGKSATLTLNEALYGMATPYISVYSMISNVNRSACHLGYDSMKVYYPHRYKRKYLHSKFRYYSNTDAEFNIETNPGPSLISQDHQYFNATLNRTDTPRNVNASRSTTIPVCINNGRYAHINHLYYQRQLGHNPLNCINISTTSTWSAISTPSQPSLHLCIMNVRSIKNKSAEFVDYVTSCKADLFALTETWLSENDDAHRAEITPTGFKLIDHSRKNRRGGGTGLIFRGILNVEKVAARDLRSFEYLELIVSSGTFKFRLVILYRPPYSPSHPVSTSTFIADFADYLETLILSTEPLVITGDFNIHVDDSTNPDTARLLDLLDSMGLRQHVNQPTHELGHTIDLIITRQSDSIISGSPVTDHLFSDHLSVLTTLRATKPKIIWKEQVYRKIKSIDLDSFCSDLATSEVCQDTPRELNELVDCYNRSLTSILEKHAPLKRKIIPQRRRIPWYNDQILNAKRLRRKAEKKWRLSNSTLDLTAYKSARNFATNLIKKARFDFYHNLIQENSSDQGKLFRISKQLLNQNFDVPLPPHSSKAILANEMANFFVEKISNIRSKFKVCTNEDCQDCVPVMDLQVPSFSSFQVITEEEARIIIMSLAKKSSALDPIPTPLVVKCIDVLLPVITKMINISLDSGHFPSSWREALVLPTLKKTGLDTVFKHY